MRKAKIKALEYYLPDQTLTNQNLSDDFPEWSVKKIEEKTGIVNRHIAAAEECSSDLAYKAAVQLFAAGACDPLHIDYILLCTQSPDYFLPTTACLLQHRLGLSTRVGAIDYNLGCSGYVYGLGLAKGLIETEQAENVLLLTADTYSKFIKRDDKSVRTLFGDAATATLVHGKDAAEQFIGPFVYGTDGSGARELIVEKGGMRDLAIHGHEEDRPQEKPALYMNGPQIFNFSIKTIPQLVYEMLNKTGFTINDIDWFVFHQANTFMLEYLRKKINIPSERFVISMRDFGNTVSSTIPIALKLMDNEKKLVSGNTIMLVGFGVGYSWAAAILRWSA